MIHDFITDLASDRLPAKDFTYHSVKSAAVNIDKTDTKVKKDPEVSGSHT